MDHFDAGVIVRSTTVVVAQQKNLYSENRRNDERQCADEEGDFGQDDDRFKEQGNDDGFGRDQSNDDGV